MIKNFLENIRAADEPTKRKVAIVVTIVCMVIIIFVWLAYFNPFVAVSAPQGTPAAGYPSAGQ